MKQITFATATFALALAVFMAPAFAHADGPTIMIVGASNIYYNDARVQVLFNASTVDYSNLPSLTVQYADTKTGEIFSTGAAHEYTTSHTEVFDLQNLHASTTYSYRAILTYGGGTITTEPQTFTTPGQNGSYVSTSATTQATTQNQSTTSQTATNSTTTSSSSSSASTSKLSLQAVAKKVTPANLEKNISNNVATGGVTHANGIVLYISDEHARVYQDDSVTFTIKTQNTHSYSINDARVTVELPDQYEFSSSGSDADYDSHANTVTYEFGRIAAQATESFTFKADAVGEGNGTVYTKATMEYDGGQLSASDHDAYESGSKSVLGASVFGAGFFPQTFAGWFLILLLIVIIIVAARRYVKAQPAQPAPAK
ncbi:MAG: hypothetical protein JWM20_958 [Patescibacteria group bacterium]|nr:hypothetical protein [Patescibacteria group bacterium]